MRRTYDIEISGTAEPRRVRAEIIGDRGILARSSWITLAAGDRRNVQVTLDAPPGLYRARQATNVGSNIHEDHVTIDLGAIEHRES